MTFSCFSLFQPVSGIQIYKDLNKLKIKSINQFKIKNNLRCKIMWEFYQGNKVSIQKKLIKGFLYMKRDRINVCIKGLIFLNTFVLCKLKHIKNISPYWSTFKITLFIKCLDYQTCFLDESFIQVKKVAFIINLTTAIRNNRTIFTRIDYRQFKLFWTLEFL